MSFFGLTLSLLDLAGLGIFLLCWLGYTFYAEISINRKNNLVCVMYQYRLQWMQEMIKRKDRIVDSRIIDNLMQSVTFFASTSILILAGLVTLMGYGERALQMLSFIPFTLETPMHLWVIKTLLLIIIFTYAFFKHTWALRLFNYASIFIVAVPNYEDAGSTAMGNAPKLAKVLSNAARHFNMGMRAYYFGMAALGWFIHPVLFMFTSLWVVWVLYRREYMSRTLAILSE